MPETALFHHNRADKSAGPTAEACPAADFSPAGWADFAPYYQICPAIGGVPFLFNIPHSGRLYPQNFMAQTRLDRRTVRASEDRYVDLLFADAPACGAVFMAARFPRAAVDVNRHAFALDSAMFSGADKALLARLPREADQRYLRAGFGAIARNAAAGLPLYRHKLPFSEALERLLRLYFPYHRALLGLLLQLRQKFGEALLLDCHSMPGAATGGGSPAEAPDIALGNCFGRACCPQLLDLACRLLADMGYKVDCNYPYAGGHITAYYGRPELNIQALQIELNRDLYLNPQTLEPNAGFAALKADISRFSARLIDLWQRQDCAAAAE